MEQERAFAHNSARRKAKKLLFKKAKQERAESSSNESSHGTSSNSGDDSIEADGIDKQVWRNRRRSRHRSKRKGSLKGNVAQRQTQTQLQVPVIFKPSRPSAPNTTTCLHTQRPPRTQAPRLQLHAFTNKGMWPSLRAFLETHAKRLKEPTRSGAPDVSDAHALSSTTAAAPAQHTGGTDTHWRYNLPIHCAAAVHLLPIHASDGLPCAVHLVGCVQQVWPRRQPWLPLPS